MIPVLVPRRVADERRERLWSFCQSWWAQRPGYRLVEGHHTDGPFNRSAAVNRAAELAGDWQVAVIADGDVVLDLDQVDAAVKIAADTGRLTFAFTRYVALKQEITDRVLDGYDGDWTTGRTLAMKSHVSSCAVVPRALWDVVDGFDERFEGWGYEDQAFAAACRVLGGGIERVEGDVFHLWHPPVHESTVLHKRSRHTAAMRAGEALCNRYWSATDPTAMHQLLAERSEPDGVLLAVITDGRRDCITRAVRSLGDLVGLPIVRRVIFDDSADPEYQAWLRRFYPTFELVCGPKRLGFGGNVRRAWDTALASGQRWVFWLEDDFEPTRPVPLDAMARVLDENPHLAQMALRRQAWFPAERKAGGVVEQNPDAYEDHDDGVAAWLEHRLFYTTNPALIPRRTFATHTWPDGAHSEAVFSRRLFTEPAVRCGYWGRRSDDPWVIHDGVRQGTGY